ncbi:uncharacterized protein LOC110985686 [Acanthaster planci]|uniref:Uncharacterized protein LOC110985686 n=1 Tax=Acanthaster planci TaxID=133434 RepID=A0A8B7ZA95_ACAPL|nr:uncharacterized protein LOC110985686 [Acanthaster planci]XP_022102576.1 uncharacterized protein LOC110985686 [Acanthaster planci]XP_022102577.1 uncharacterized protein LOC110985686 [Acanthaster planci]XP_022102578.1 uncharacterized protein LOC110985686 [Acanthaster planci]
MGVLGQLGLLMRKNLKLRLRAPVSTLTLLLWPILLLLAIALVRTRFQPQTKPNCHYDSKAMPSSGLVPFLQSFTCDLSTSCKTQTNSSLTGNELPPYLKQARLAQIANSLNSVFNNTSTVESLKNLPEVIKPLTELSKDLDSESLTNFTDRKYHVRDFFHNVSDVQRYLKQEAGLDGSVVDALLGAQMNVYQLLELTGYIDFKGIVCNSTRLSKVLAFPPETDMDGVSQALCSVQDGQISIIIDELQTKLDVPYLINEFSEFLKALGQTDWSAILDNAGVLLEQLQNIGNLGEFVEGLPNLLEVVKLVPTFQELLKQFEQGTLEKQLDIVVSLMESLDMQLMNATWWKDVTNIISRGQSLFKLVGKFLNDFQDNVPIADFFRNETIILTNLKKQLNLTNDDLKAILQLQLKQDRIAELLQLLTSTSHPAELLCSPGVLDQFFALPANTSSNLMSLQKTLCTPGTDGNLALDVLLNNTDILLFVDKVTQVLNSPPTPVQWDVLLDDIMSMVKSVQNLPDFLQRLPELLASYPQIFDQSSLLQTDWTQILAGSLQGNMTIEEVLQQWSRGPIFSVIQDILSQTPAWQDIKYQLILQNMAMDIELQILNIFTGGSCPDGWHSNLTSCYKYVHETAPDLMAAWSGCHEIHRHGYPVAVNHEVEQSFLESIGEDSLSWLGLVSYGPDYAFWIGDGSFLVYQNWFPSVTPTSTPNMTSSVGSCAKVNFGTDGLWHHANCSKPTDSYLCEAVQDHRLIELLRQDPADKVIHMLLELGPDVNEVILRAFLNATYIEALVRMPPEEQVRALCMIDLSSLPHSIDVAEVRQKLCSLNLTEILAEQMRHWQIPELQEKITDYIALLNSASGPIPAEYAHYANLSALVHKYDLTSRAWSDIFARPFDFQLILDGYTDIIGNQSKAWEEMFFRVLQSQNGVYPLGQASANQSIADLLDVFSLQINQVLDMLHTAGTNESANLLLLKGLITAGQGWLKSLQGQEIPLEDLFQNQTALLQFFLAQQNRTAEDIQMLFQAWYRAQPVSNSSIVMDDWQRLLEELLRATTDIQDLPSLLQRLPELMRILQQPLNFSGEWSGLAGLIQGNMTVTEFLQHQSTVDLLEALDMELGIPSPPWWRTIKDIILRGQKVLSSLLAQVYRYQEPLTLGELFRDQSIFRDLFQTQLNLTQADVEALRRTSIDMDKAIPLLLSVYSGQENLADVFCTGNLSLVDYLILPDSAHSAPVRLAGSLQAVLCHLVNSSSNADAFLRMVLMELDLTMLSDKISAAVGQPVGTIDDWGHFLQKVANISEDIQQLPRLINKLPSLFSVFQRPLNFSGDWTGVISWLSDNQTFEEAMQEFTYGMYPPLFQNLLSQLEIWPLIQQQLISQNLMMDLQIAIVKLFTGGTCRPGWHGDNFFCYKFVDEASNWYTASWQVCPSADPQSSLTFVYNEQEQQFLQSIGPDQESWIFRSSFLFSTEYTYENWESEPQGDYYCGAANFGTDGLWHQANCSAQLNSSVCKVIQDHILITRLKEQPFANATRTLLELGPNVTEAVIQTFLNASKLQMLLDTNRDDHSTLLCSEGFVDLSPYDAAVRSRLCDLDPLTLLQEQSAFWNIPQIQTAFERYYTFMTSMNTTVIPAEFAPYANLSELLIKNAELQALISDASIRRFDPKLLWEDTGITVTGTDAEWIAMANRIQALLNQQQLMLLLEMATTTSVPFMLRDVLHYNNAVLQLANTALQTTNQLFALIEAFSQGQVFSGAMPETERFLQGIMGLIDNGPALIAALSATWDDPSKYSDLIGSSDVIALFCDGTVRQSWLNANNQSINTTALDEYLCKVNYSALVVEVKDVINYDQIFSQIISLQTEDFNTTMPDSISVEDLMRSIEALQLNLQSLPFTVTVFQHRYDVASLGTVSQALFRAVLMGYGNISLINQNNELDLGSILYSVPGLKMLLTTLDADGTVDLKQVHAYITFMNRFLDQAKETSCRDGWQGYSGTCYRYLNETLPHWDLVTGACYAQAQSTPLHVNSETEQMFLESFGPNADVWLDDWFSSLNDGAYSNFAPSNDSFMSCIKANFGGDGLWYPANCSDHYSYICEAKPELNLTLGLLKPLTNDSSISHIINTLEQTLGVETLNTILSSPIDPFQLSSLVVGADWRKAVCDVNALRALFAFPDAFNVTQLSEVLCGDAFLAAVQALTNDTQVLEYLLNEIGALQVSEFNSTSFLQDAQTFLFHMASLGNYRINSYLPLTFYPLREGFNLSAWQQALSVETLLSSLDSIDMILTNESWYRDAIKELRSVAYFVEYFTDRILVLKGKHLVFPEIRNLLANITETEKMFEVVAGFTPELTDAVLSLVVQQDKLEEFLGLSNPLVALCDAGNFSSYFTLPAYSSADILALEGAVCSVDLQKLQMEFLQVFPIDTFMSKYLAYVNTSSSDNLSAISHRFLTLYEKTAAFLADPFTVNINETWLNDTFSEVVRVLQVWSANQAQMNPDNFRSTIVMLESLEAQFKNQSWWEDIKGPIRELTSILDYANMKLRPLPGQNFTFFDILPQTTAELLQRLMDDFPEIVTALSQSYVNMAKLETLNGTDDLVSLLCDNSTGMTELIQFLPGVNTSVVNSVLCSLDYILLASEWSQELVFFEERRNLPLNWTASFESVTSLVETFTRLVQSPPQLAMYDAAWFSEKLRQTEAILASLVTATTDITGAELDNVLLFLDNALSGRGEFYNSFVMQYRLEDYINRFLTDQMSAFIGQNWTFPSLEGLFADAANVRSLFVLWDLAPDVIDAFMSLSVRPEKWVVFWNTSDPFSVLCSTNQFASFFELPAGSPSNLTAVQEAVCAVNFTLVPLELSTHYQLSQIQADLERIAVNDPSLGPFNWTAWMTNRNRLAEVIGHLVSMPPKIVVDYVWWNATEPRLQDVLNSWLVYFQQMAADNQVNSTVQLLQGIEADLKAAGVWNVVRPYLEIFTLSLESTANQLREQVRLQTGLLNATAVHSLVQSLSVTPDQLKASLADSAFSVFALAQIYIQGDWDNVFCSYSTFSLIYPLPPAVNSTAVQQAMCTLNQTEFFSHASKIYSIDVLKLQQQMAIIFGFSSGPMTNFDWARIERYIQELMTLMTELQHIPISVHGDALHNLTLLLEVLNSQADQNLMIFIQVLEDIQPYFQDDRIVVQIRDAFYASLNLTNVLNSAMPLDGLPLLEAELKRLDLWQSVKPFLDFANYLLDGIDRNLHPGGEAIPAFLYNRTVLDRFFSEILNTATPDLALESVIDGVFPVSLLAYHHLSDQWDYFCHPEYFFWQLPGLNLTAIALELCHLDRANFFGTLDNFTGVDVLGLHQSIFEMVNALQPSNNTGQDFDWDRLVNRVESIMAALQGITGLPGPGNHGNMTEASLLLQELMDGLTQFNLKLSVEILERLDTLMNRGGVWSEIQGGVAMATHIAKLFNQQLEYLAESNYTIGGIFVPNAQKVLAQYLAPEHVQALLTATINPGLLGTLTQPELLMSILCEPALFNSFIFLPPGTNSGALQTALCGLAQSDQTFLSNLTAVFNVAHIQKEIEKIIINSTTLGSLTDIDWQQSIQEFEHLVNNLLSLSMRQDFLGDFFTQWMAMSAPIANLPPMWMNMTPDFTSVCQSLTPDLLNTTVWQMMLSPALTSTHLAMEFMQDIVFTLPSHQEEFQMLVNNMTTVVEMFSVFSMVERDVIQSGSAVLFDPDLLPRAGPLTISLLKGEISGGVVCDEYTLKLVNGIPNNVNATHLSRLLCGVDKLIQTHAMQEVMRIVGFDNILPKIVAIFDTNPATSEPFDCPAFVIDSQNFMERMWTLPSEYFNFFNSFQRPEYFDLFELLPVIVANTTTADMQSLTELYHLVQPLIGPLLSNSLQGNTTNLNALLPFFELIDTYLISQLDQTGFVELSSLWSNTSVVRDYLKVIEGFSPDIIDAIINNKVNISALSELQGSIQDQLCMDDALFSKLFVFNNTAIMSEVQMLVCKSLNSTDVLSFLEGSLNITELVRAITMTSPMVVTLPEYLNQLLLALEDLSALDPALVERFVTDQWPSLVNGLTNTTDIVKLAMSAEDLIQIANSLQSVLDVLRPALENDPTFQSLVKLFDSLNGFNGLLDLIGKLPDLSLSKLFKDLADFQEFLVMDLGFSDEAALDLLSASLSLEVAASFNFTTIRTVTCSEVELTKLIEFPKGTNVTGVLQSLCRLDSQQLTVVLDGMISRLNIGAVVEELLTYTIRERFSNATSTFDELSNTATDLTNIGNSFQSLQVEFQALNLSSLAIGDITDSLLGNSAAQVSSTTLLLETVCGNEALLELLSSDIMNLFSRRKRDAGRSRKRREEELDVVPGSTPFCSSLYNAIQEGYDGRLAWRYIKPILLGKIPYAPINAATAKIIKESNFFFEEIATIRDVATAWLAGSNDLINLIDSKQLSLIQDFLSNSYTREILQSQLGLDGDLLASLLTSDLSSISTDDLDQLNQMAQLVVNLTACVELDRFVPSKTQGIMETKAERFSRDNLLLAAVYFSNVRDDTLPPHVHYKIRMDVENTADTNRLRDKDWTAGANNELINQVYTRGFVVVQDIIEKGIIQSQTGNNTEKPSVYLQLMPYPCHVVDKFVERVSYLLPVVLFFVFIGAVGTMTHQLVYEKELGIEELMKAMGLRGGVNLFSWFLNNLVLMTIVCAIMVLILKVGNILPSSDWFLVFFFLMCFSFSVIMMSFLISTFFQKAHIAAFASVLIFTITYVPYIPYAILQQNIGTFGQTFAFSLISTCAFTISCNELAIKEAQTVGVQWDAFAQGFHQVDVFGFNWKCVAMLWDGLIYYLLALYISSVFPGRHGVPKPWYFIFTPRYWLSCFSPRSDFSRGQTYAGGSNKNPDVEMEPTNVPCGISIIGLTKKYSQKKTAVDDLTLNFYEDQITSFLGRNGAGKTTTISIIMGLFPATSGEVFIYGKDVRKRLHSVRKELGLCPQHNALYDQLTVREHMEMYGRLKGMPLKDIFHQSEDLINDVGLTDAANEKVCNLSGGMKRKLSVIIAFLGGSNIVILDEPTSGVDPHARRSIWDLISKNKRGRTILLCTHFMDEADLLGDRIAILDEGQLRCCGSSAFLKARFTKGYTLTIAKQLASNQSTPETKPKARNGAQGREDLNRNRAVENVYIEMTDLKKSEAGEDLASTSSSSGVSSCGESFNLPKMTSLIQTHVPTAIFKEDVGTEVSFTLPVSSGQTAKFQSLFNELDTKLPELHASSYGLSDATLEEVFLNVSSPEGDQPDGSKDKTKIIPDSTVKRTSVRYDMQPSTLRQFLAILLKRFHYTKRDWWGFIWALLMPMLMLLLAVVFGTLSSGEANPSLHFAPSLYGPGDYVFFSNSDSHTAAGSKMTSAMFSEPGLGTTCMQDFDDSSGTCRFVERFFSKPVSDYTSAEIEDILVQDRTAPDCSCSKSFMECPAGATGVKPPEWRMNTTDILQDLSLKVDLHKYLLRSTADFRFRRYNGLTLHAIKSSDGTTKDVIKAWFNNKGFHAMPISLNTANNLILRSSLPANQDPATYGISAYNHPFQFSEGRMSLREAWDQIVQNFGICLMIVLAFCLIPATFATFLVMEYNNGCKRLHYVSGVTPTGYWLANLVWDMFMYLIPVCISLIIISAFGMRAFGSSSNISAFCLLLFLYGLATACQMYVLVPFFKSTGTAFIVYFCLAFGIAILTIIPKFLQEAPLGFNNSEHDAFYYIDKVFLIFSPYCLAAGLIDLLYNQSQADIYSTFGLDTYADPFSFELLGWKFVALAIESAVAFIFLLVVERTCRWQCKDCKTETPDHHGVEDGDVNVERRRVLSGDTKTDLVCVKNLTKVYQSFGNSSLVAVDDLCVGIPGGQCFGLLGVNGAGKTTTFRMITNDLMPTCGSVTVRSNSVGYCPQGDALYNCLTGTELLTCYARIKGLSGKRCKVAVKSVVQQMGMRQYVDNRIGTYSGGMKRSLSTAIALLGNPQVVLMDEPTSGMDPITKQAVWSNVLAMIKNGHSVILTSHSMEECELLCTRLAIMVNGRFQCLGSPQQVKHRHGDGYTLILRISDETLDWSSVMDFVASTFPDAILKERHHNMVRYQLPLETKRLADIFGAVEDNKARLGIQEYSVTQTTLDQVFVNFAKRQTDGHRSSQESHQEYTNQAFILADEA